MRLSHVEMMKVENLAQLMLLQLAWHATESLAGLQVVAIADVFDCWFYYGVWVAFIPTLTSQVQTSSTSRHRLCIVCNV